MGERIEGTKQRGESIWGKAKYLLMYHGVCQILDLTELINLVVISQLIFPGDPYHSVEMGLLYGGRLLGDAVGAMFWGILADRCNRSKLFSSTTFGTGILVFLMAFAPIGTYMVAFQFWFIIHFIMAFVKASGGPNIHSLSSDLFNSNKRSQFFGAMGIVVLLFGLTGMTVGSIVFRDYWRIFYIIMSIVYFLNGFLLGFVFKEPKRGGSQEELRNVLQIENANYKYTITKQTLKNVVFSRSNVLILIEGVFNCIIIGIVLSLAVPYVQAPPRNISAFNHSIFILIYMTVGGMAGNIVFPKIADKLGGSRESAKKRIQMIVLSLILTWTFALLMFMVPLPNYTVSEGASIAIQSHPMMILFGIFYLLNNFFGPLNNVNQSPLIQEINLPESQATVRSLNTFWDVAGQAMGSIIGGILLFVFNYDFQLTMVVVTMFSFPGLVIWFFVAKGLEKDIGTIKQIIGVRAEEIKQEISKNNNENQKKEPN